MAGDGIVAPVFSSIEEYIGHNQHRYYDVLAEVGGGGWNPSRNAKPWVRFCLTGHYQQARALLLRTREMERVYSEILELTQAKSLHDRMAMGLLQAAFGGRVRNSSYRVSADVSKNLASRDLKMLVDARLLVPEGERRGRSYVPGPAVAAIRHKSRRARRVDDPFAEDGIAYPPSRQGRLFPEQPER